MEEKQEAAKCDLELEQAASELNIGIATLFRWMKSGKIIPHRLYRRTFIPKSEVARLKESATAN